jgi:hypothetical protein
MNSHGWDESWFYKVKCVFPSHGPCWSSIDSFDIMDLFAPISPPILPWDLKEISRIQKVLYFKTHTKTSEISPIEFSICSTFRDETADGGQMNRALNWIGRLSEPRLSNVLPVVFWSQNAGWNEDSIWDISDIFEWLINCISVSHIKIIFSFLDNKRRRIRNKWIHNIKWVNRR